jgi:Phospholipase_D-nuclease N-terminal
MTVALLAYTFGTLLAYAALVAWIVAWLVGAISVFRRSDLGIGGKAVWLVVFVVLPIFGLLVYYLWDAARPRSR